MTVAVVVAGRETTCACPCWESPPCHYCGMNWHRTPDWMDRY